jgi:hypothetical protein
LLSILDCLISQFQMLKESLVKCTILVSALLISVASACFAVDPGWPRSINKNGAKLIYYQPQVDEWKDQKELEARSAVSLTPAGGKQVIGVVSLNMQTQVNPEDHTVLLNKLQVTKTYFPDLDPTQAKQMDQLVRSFFSPTMTTTISLDRLVAAVDKSKLPPPKAVNVKNDPPGIFVSQGPAVLLLVEGNPVKAKVKDTKIEAIANANWPLFYDNTNYYVAINDRWLSTPNLEGRWIPVATLPKEMQKIPKDPHFETLKNVIPPPPASGATPRVFYSAKPAEVIIFKGQPVYSSIPNTSLVYATNTDSDVFVYSPTKAYYYLTAGRWFSSPSLEGPWTFASSQLPPDFSRIPSNSPAARVLVSVPGTPEAEDAVLMAEIPHTAVINPQTAAQQVKVTYEGEPKFEPIQGTSMMYATNTTNQVIQVGTTYYLCANGVWFNSNNAQGPWIVSTSVPQQIYTIPASSPVYNVTYVTQAPTSGGNVEASYTAGYLGTFVTGLAVGAIIAGGTGYYYPPYIGPVVYGGYPYYRPWPATYGVGGYYNPYTGFYGTHYGYGGYYGGATARAGYNPYTGTYGRSATAYGPYGSRSVGQAYNPYTGTYARGASASTPWGSAGAAQAYNPRTGAYGATRQGSNAYSQWGNSVVSKNGQTAYGQHYSNAAGSVGSVQSTSGARAAGASTAYGNTYAGKSASGDMYAGHDGNVYKNNNGSWQKYSGNGNWNTVDTSNAQARAQSYQQQRTSAISSNTAARSSSSDFSGLQSDFQNRQRGEMNTQRFQGVQRSGGFRGGGFRR